MSDSVKSGDSILPFQDIEKEHWGEMGKIYNQ